MYVYTLHVACICNFHSTNRYAVNQFILGHFSSSSSYRAGSTDIPDPLSPLLPIVHRPR